MSVVSGTMTLSDRADPTATVTDEHDDAALIAAARLGDREAVDALVRRNNSWVRHVVYAAIGNPSELDDVVQHVWTNVWQQIGTLADPACWRGWLFKLARNAAFDAVERIARERRRRNGFHGARYESRRPTPPQEAVMAEQHRRVLAAIHGLPAIYREPFVLRHLEGWSYAQIGAAMELPVDTVETRLVRARRLLRAALRPEEVATKAEIKR